MNFVEFVELDTLIVVLLAATTFVFFFYFRKIKRISISHEDLPFISIIVPVRNEEKKIKRCLESLLRQDYPKFEIIVVDDRSTDSSYEIITQIAENQDKMQLHSCEESRSGWLGKCNAVDFGSRHAKGAWLAFIDADTYHHPNSIRDAISTALADGVDLISFMPVQELYSFWEQAIMPVLLGSFLLGDPLNKINDKASPRAYAYGQYILLKRDLYQAIGGHESVKDQVLDDIAIARVAKSKGFSITAVDGQPLYTVRMYTSLVELWHGWSKNLYALIDCNPIYLAGVLILLNLALLAPFVSLAHFIMMISRSIFDPQTTLTAQMLLLQFLVIALWFKRTTLHYRGAHMWHLLIIPLGTIVVSVLYLYSAFCFITGFNVLWKDRRYCLDSSMKIRDDLCSTNHATKH